MSVNRSSDLNTSLSRTDGVHHALVNLTSSGRDKNVDPDSADAELSFEEQYNVIAMEILNFELPHTRYAINKTNNNFYLSEKVSEDEYYFYSLRASTGGYSISNLAVSMELSTRCPVMFNGDRSMGNTYNFLSAGVFGKVAVVSSGDYEYTIHNATETAILTDYKKKSDTEAEISFLASWENMYKPGALMLFKPFQYTDREVQVVENTGDRSVRVIGDLSDIDESTFESSLSSLVPYSATNSTSMIMGMGDVDLSNNSHFEVLSIGSAFSGSDTDPLSSVMMVVNFPIFVSPEDSIYISGVPGFLNDGIYTVSVVHDDTHLEIFVDKSKLWEHTSGTISNADDPGTTWDITDINLSATDNNKIALVVTPGNSTTLVAGDYVKFNGFSAPEFEEITGYVIAVSSSSNDVVIQFSYPSTYLFKEGESWVSPVNPDTGILTTYLTPYRFDLSRGRRMVLCRAIIDNQEAGSIIIPALSNSRFFGRIQLFSGADLVNFLGPDTAVGAHEFNSVLKRLSKIRFQFFNEDGTKYDFIGVDYTIFLRLTLLDSNSGI